LIDGVTISVLVMFAGIFSAGFSLIYTKMLRMTGSISELNTKMDFVYNNLNVALEFKSHDDRINKK